MNTMFRRCLLPITLLVVTPIAHAQTNSSPRAFSIVRGSGNWAVSKLLWSPNGKQLAVSTVRSFEKFDENLLYEYRAEQLWNVDHLRPQAVVRAPTEIGSMIRLDKMAFSPDSALFALDLNTKGVNEGVPIWRARNGKLVRVLDATAEPLAFVSNRLIVAALKDTLAIGGKRFGIEFRDVKTDRVQRRVVIQVPRNRLSAYSRPSSGGGSLPQCLVSPDGRQAALMLWKYRDLKSGNSKGAETLLFDPRTGRHRQLLRVGLKENFEPVAFSRDGGVLAMLEFWSDAQRAKVFDCRTGQLLSTLKAPPKDLIVALALSPDGKTIALATARGLLSLQDVKDRSNMRTLQTGPVAVTSLAFSPNGQTLAVGERSGAVSLWKLKNS